MKYLVLAIPKIGSTKKQVIKDLLAVIGASEDTLLMLEILVKTHVSEKAKIKSKDKTALETNTILKDLFKQCEKRHKQ